MRVPYRKTTGGRGRCETPEPLWPGCTSGGRSGGRDVGVADDDEARCHEASRIRHASNPIIERRGYDTHLSRREGMTWRVRREEDDAAPVHARHPYLACTPICVSGRDGETFAAGRHGVALGADRRLPARFQTFGSEIHPMLSPRMSVKADSSQSPRAPWTERQVQP